MPNRQTEDQLQLLLRMEMVRDVVEVDVENVGGVVDTGAVTGAETSDDVGNISWVVLYPLVMPVATVQTLPCSWSQHPPGLWYSSRIQHHRNNNTGATVRVVPHIIDIYYTLLQHLNLCNELPIELQQLRTLFIQL